MSNAVGLLTALTPLMTALTPIMLGIFGIIVLILKRSTNVKLQVVADTAAESARAAEVRSDKIMATTKDIHTLVNSQYGLALALILERTSRVYELSKDPKDKEKVDEAAAKLADHEARQRVVDEGRL